MLVRIAVLSNAYPPQHEGGAARIAAIQVEMLKKAGYEVRVWSPPVSWFGEPAWKRFFCHLADLGPNEALVEDILAWQPDVLITHNLTGCGFATPSTIQLRGVRWVHVLHDIQLFEPSGRLYTLKPVTFWQLFWARLREPFFKRPDMVISPTRWLIEQHRYRFLLKGLEIRCELLPNPGPASVPLARLQFHEPRVRLLFVGHVTEAKGSRLLMELVKKMRLPFELHVVGDGPDLSALKAASPHVVAHGSCSSEEVLEHMREADLLLVPSSIHENQPTVILEAASVGLPVIAAHRGGIVETLGIAAAHMVCPHRGECWTKAIERLRDPHTYQHHVHLMHHVAEAHDPEVYAQKFISLVTSNR